MMFVISLGSVLMSGCNLLNLTGAPSLTDEQYKLSENMCNESRKNEA